MKYKTIDELKGIVARNADKIRTALDAKFGDASGGFSAEFAFEAEEIRYHCLITVTEAGEVKLDRAYAVDESTGTGIDMNRPDAEPEDAEFVMAALADDVDRLCGDPDDFPCIDLTRTGAERGAWDPMDA